MSRFLLALLPYLQAVPVWHDRGTLFVLLKLCGQDVHRPGDHPHHLVVFCRN